MGKTKQSNCQEDDISRAVIRHRHSNGIVPNQNGYQLNVATCLSYISYMCCIRENRWQMTPRFDTFSPLMYWILSVFPGSWRIPRASPPFLSSSKRRRKAFWAFPNTRRREDSEPREAKLGWRFGWFQPPLRVPEIRGNVMDFKVGILKHHEGVTSLCHQNF